MGGPQVQQVKLYAAPTAVGDVTKLGKIERLNLAKSLPVPKVRDPSSVGEM